MGSKNRFSIDAPATYRIDIYGHLHEGWSNSLSGMKISKAKLVDDLPRTELTGNLIDQAALLGVLNTLYNLGYTLLSVERDVDPANHKGE